MGEAMFSFSNVSSEIVLKEGNNQLKCFFPKDFFQSGQYFLSLFIVKDKREAIFVEKDITSFTVVDGGREMGVYMGREPGYIKPTFIWENQS
jgi:lipopolysaccharide transport system ATP-binding protein